MHNFNIYNYIVIKTFYKWYLFTIIVPKRLYGGSPNIFIFSFTVLLI